MRRTLLRSVHYSTLKFKSSSFFYLNYQSKSLLAPNKTASHINPLIRKKRRPTIPIFLKTLFIFSLTGKDHFLYNQNYSKHLKCLVTSLLLIDDYCIAIQECDATVDAMKKNCRVHKYSKNITATSDEGGGVFDFSKF